jgi:uncharacterized membrane protein
MGHADLMGSLYFRAIALNCHSETPIDVFMNLEEGMSIQIPKPPGLEALKALGIHPRNVNKEHEESLTFLDRMALKITVLVGTMGFFLLIAIWTITWTGYNMIASLFPKLGMRPFDPFPAFVAYLLISNVIQILLMPLIMVGQNLQGRHAELRAENDFQINLKAEKEINMIISHLEYQNSLLLMIIENQGVNHEEALKMITKNEAEIRKILSSEENQEPANITSNMKNAES